jgi:hypothetical protein
MYLESVADKVHEAEDPQLLCRLIEQWANHRMSMGMIRDILMYMVRPPCLPCDSISLPLTGPATVVRCD